MFVLIALKPRELARVRTGQKLAVHIPDLEGNPVFPGEVVLVDPRANGRGLFPVKLLLDNPDLRIGVGFRALLDLTDC